MHVQRTGGSSVISSLRGHCLWSEDNNSKLNKLVSRLPFRRSPENMYFRGHDSLAFVQRRLKPQVFNSYSKVAFVRNPYSWLVSLYATYKRGPNHRHHPKVAAMSGFAEYIDWEIQRNKRFQSKFLVDEQGQVNIDFLGRYEQLDADYHRLCKFLQVGVLPLPHRNQNKCKHYREYYDAETLERVSRHWAEDIKLLGYDFEGNRQPCPLDRLEYTRDLSMVG